MLQNKYKILGRIFIFREYSLPNHEWGSTYLGQQKAFCITEDIFFLCTVCKEGVKNIPK